MTVRAFAHRGGATHPDLIGLENTLTAFRHAAALGYRFIETDVHLTADGVLIAFHDPRLDRVTDTTGQINQLTAAEVAAACIGETEQVPTLAQVYAELPHVHFNVDLKSDGTEAALARFIAEHDAWDRFTIGSFSRRRLRAFRALTHGRVPTSASPFEVALWRLCPSAWLARRLAPGPARLQIPHRQRGVTVCSAGLVRRAHRTGLQVDVWTIDDPVEMVELVDRGVDGLMTDRTDTLKQVLIERGLW